MLPVKWKTQSIERGKSLVKEKLLITKPSEHYPTSSRLGLSIRLIIALSSKGAGWRIQSKVSPSKKGKDLSVSSELVISIGGIVTVFFGEVFPMQSKSASIPKPLSVPDLHETFLGQEDETEAS